MSEQQRINMYLKQGVAAAKAGDKSTARQLFEKVIELDKNNEKAWLYMAGVVETDEQRRVCLGNVLYLNPNNEKAKQALTRIEMGERMDVKGGGKTGAGGLNPRILVFSGVFVVALIVLVLVMLLGGGGGSAPTGGDTAGTTEVVELSTPTPPPPTSTVPLPPTWTPSLEPTIKVTPTAEIFPTPPALPGRLAYGSGPRFFADRFLGIYYAQTDGAEPFNLGNEDERTRGRNPSFSPDGRYLVYEMGATSGTSNLRLLDFLGENARLITLNMPDIHLASEEQPMWSPAAGKLELAFSAFRIEATGMSDYEIYVMTFQTIDAAPTIVQVTDDDFDSTWPAWSPDGSKIIYVTDRRAQGGVDLRVLDLGGFGQAYVATLEAATLQAAAGEATPAPPTETPVLEATSEAPAGLVTPTEEPIREKPYDTPLTTDGNALRERAPDWSPNGRSLVFEGTTVNIDDKGDYDGYDSDIYIIDDVFAAGAAPRLLFPLDTDETARDMQPRFSPDGKYIAFSSNRTGSWEIYIMEVATGTLYQVTNNDQINMVGDWGE
ncbi:MAG: PD40 domain-containing protein [Anaerolineae bacterium]|nr:PD40 domain-containing protein [Anaerolineae bacterium]